MYDKYDNNDYEYATFQSEEEAIGFASVHNGTVRPSCGEWVVRYQKAQLDNING